MRHQLFRVRAGTTGPLILMAAPQRASLRERIAICRSIGVEKIVSLLDEEEARLLGLEDEAAACDDLGIAFEQFAIKDYGLPDYAAFTILVNGIADSLCDGTGIAIHCRAGIGRTGTTASCVLQILGHTPDAAIEIVSAARRKPIPETAEQAAFIRRFGIAAVDLDRKSDK